VNFTLLSKTDSDTIKLHLQNGKYVDVRSGTLDTTEGLAVLRAESYLVVASSQEIIEVLDTAGNHVPSSHYTREGVKLWSTLPTVSTNSNPPALDPLISAAIGYTLGAVVNGPDEGRGGKEFNRAVTDAAIKENVLWR
jgi:hypothetical protein